MEERQVSIDGVTHATLSIFVIATQNPSYHRALIPCQSPNSTVSLCVSLWLSSVGSRKSMLLQQDASAPLAQILNEENLREMQREVTTIHTSDAIIHYILRLVSESRESNDYPNPYRHERVEHTTRCQSLGVCFRKIVTPEDVQAVFVAITAHRLTLSSHQLAQGQQPMLLTVKLSQKLLDSIDPLAA